MSNLTKKLTGKELAEYLAKRFPDYKGQIDLTESGDYELMFCIKHNPKYAIYERAMRLLISELKDDFKFTTKQLEVFLNDLLIEE